MHVIFVAIFRALFLAPGSFVSLTDISLSGISTFPLYLRGARERRSPRTAMQFSALRFTAIDCQLVQFRQKHKLCWSNVLHLPDFVVLHPAIVIALSVIWALSCFQTPGEIRLICIRWAKGGGLDSLLIRRMEDYAVINDRCSSLRKISFSTGKDIPPVFSERSKRCVNDTDSSVERLILEQTNTMAELYQRAFYPKLHIIPDKWHACVNAGKYRKQATVRW